MTQPPDNIYIHLLALIYISLLIIYNNVIHMMNNMTYG